MSKQPQIIEERMEGGTKIIVMNPAATHISSLPFFASKVKTVTILTEWRTKLLLESYGINAKYTLISKNRYKIKLHSGRILQFIKAPFLPL